MKMLQTLRSTIHERALSIAEDSGRFIVRLTIWTIIWYFADYLIVRIAGVPHTDDLLLRITCSIFAFGPFIRRWLPPRLMRAYPYYIALYTSFVIPFFMSYTMMKNGWHDHYVMVAVAAFFMMVVVAEDWLFIGIFSSLALLLAAVAVFVEDGGLLFTYFRPDHVVIALFTLTGGIVVVRQKKRDKEARLALVRRLGNTLANEMRAPLAGLARVIDTVQGKLGVDEERRIEPLELSGEELASLARELRLGAETVSRGNKLLETIMAAIEGGSIDRRAFKRVSLSETVRMAVGEYAYAAGERELVTIGASEEVEVLGDRDLLIIMVQNIMMNALRFSSRPGFRIVVSSFTYGDKGSIVVRDNGPGITPQQEQHLLQTPSRETFRADQGLGLAFCRLVAESSGGMLAYQPVPEGGSDFVVSLPAYGSEPAGAIKREILSRKRILVADDQSPNRKLVSHLFEKLHCRVDQAENGRVAFEMAVENSYDLVLMDMEMPVMNGDVAAGMLRAGMGVEPAVGRHYRSVPVVAFTALSKRDAARRASEAGMDGYLLKPVTQEHAQELVERLFASENAQQHLSLPRRAVRRGAVIMLVDDNRMVRELLKASVEELGYRTILAENGRQALELLACNRVELVIMDKAMPVMDGLTAARRIMEEYDAESRPPVIMLSGYAESESRESLREAGIGLFLKKPVNSLELSQAITAMLMPESQQAETVEPAAEGDEAPGPVFDLTVLETYLKSDQEGRMSEMIALFVEDVRQRAAEVEAAQREDDREKARIALHSLKGACGFIGAVRLQALSARFESDLLHERWPEEAGWLDELLGSLSLFEEAYAGFLREAEAAGTLPAKG